MTSSLYRKRASDRVRNFLIVSRANIQIASLPTAALGIVLAARKGRDLIQPAVFLYLFIFFVILTFSCHLNCLSDLEVDKKYKIHLSAAVQSIGTGRLKKIISFEAGLALASIIVLALLKSNAIYLLVSGGLAIGYAYSAPPLRIKKRGTPSFLPVMLGLYFLPVLAGYYLVAGRLSLFILLLGVGYAMVMEGITIINICEDYEEDEASGIRTLAHVTGIRNALYAGSALVCAGGAIDLGSIFAWRIAWRNLKPISGLTLVLPSLFFLVSIVFISWRLYLVGSSANPRAFSKIYAIKMPLWFLITRYPLLLMSLAILFE